MNYRTQQGDIDYGLQIQCSQFLRNVQKYQFDMAYSNILETCFE